MKGKIQCQLCMKWFKLISSTHLKNKHNWTQKDYIKKYGTIVSEEYSKGMKKSLKELNKNPQYKERHKQAVRRGFENWSEEGRIRHSKKLSEAMTGRTVSESHKKAVAEGMKNMSPDAKRVRAKKISDKLYENYADGTRDRLRCNIKRTRKSLTTRCPKTQKKLLLVVKEIFPNAELNYPLIVNEKLYFIDVFVPLYNLCFEHDNSKSHSSRWYVENDQQRDENLQNNGYKVIHYVDIVPTEQRIREDIEKIGIEPIVIYKY